MLEEEHRQVDLAQERLGKLGLQIERLPGGHLTTNEHPEALARLIAKFERGLSTRWRGRHGEYLEQRAAFSVDDPGPA